MTSLRQQLVFPPAIAANDMSADMNALSIKAVFTFNTLNSRYVCGTTTFSSPVTPVRSTSIKSTPVHTRLVAVLRAQLGQEPTNVALAEANPALKSYFKGTTGRRPAHGVIIEPTDEALEVAAAIHTLARAIGDFPVLAIARSFGIEHRHAVRWAGKARRRGLLL